MHNVLFLSQTRHYSSGSFFDPLLQEEPFTHRNKRPRPAASRGWFPPITMSLPEPANGNVFSREGDPVYTTSLIIRSLTIKVVRPSIEYSLEEFQGTHVNA